MLCLGQKPTRVEEMWFFLTRKSGNLPFLVCVKCDMMSFVVYLNLSWQSQFISLGWFLFRKFYFFSFYMVSSCSIWSPIFKKVFVFDVRPFLLLSVKFLGFNGNFNGKTTKINKMAKNHFSGVQNGSQGV